MEDTGEPFVFVTKEDRGSGDTASLFWVLNVDMMSEAAAFIYSLVQQMFIEHLLCTREDCGIQQWAKSPHPHGADILRQKMDNKQGTQVK